jgi:hypothetical protein
MKKKKKSLITTHYANPSSRTISSILMYNVIKQCDFIHMAPKNIPMGCPNLVQGDLD